MSAICFFEVGFFVVKLYIHMNFPLKVPESKTVISDSITSAC